MSPAFTPVRGTLRMSSNHKEQQDDRKATFLAKSTCGLWAVAALAFLGLLHWATPRAVIAFEGLDMEVPTIGQWMLALGTEIRTTGGLLMALGVWCVTLLPFAAGARRHGGSKFYATLSLLAFCAIGLLWFSTVQPVDLISTKLLPGAK